MNCPECRNDTIGFWRVMRSGIWSAEKCSNCGIEVTPKPIVHLVVSLSFPVAFIAVFFVYGGGPISEWVIILMVASVFSCGIALLIFRYMPLANLRSQRYKIERNILLFAMGVLLVIGFTVSQ